MPVICITSEKMFHLMNRERLDLYESMKNKGVLFFYTNDDRMNNNIHNILSYLNVSVQNLEAIIFEEAIWNKKLSFSTTCDGVHELKIPKATFLTDYWQETQYLKKYIKNNDISTLMITHQQSYPFVRKYLPEIDNVIFSPFCIVDNLYTIEKNKTIDVLNATGVHPVTPLRNRLFQLLPQLNSMGVRYTQIDHPGKRINSSHKKDINYSDMLLQSHFSVATTTIYNLSVRKYFEIMAAGATVIGNETGLPEHELVRNNMVRIDMSMSDNEILRIICDAVADKASYTRRAEQLRSTVMKYASRDTVADTILEFLRSPAVQTNARLRGLQIPHDYGAMRNTIDRALKAVVKRMPFIAYKGIPS